MKRIINYLFFVGVIVAFGFTELQLGGPGQILTMSPSGKDYRWADPAPANLFGAGPPAGTLGSNGQNYYDKNTWNVYYKSAGIWTLQGNIKGATGAQGIAGSAGATGPAGPIGATGPAGPQGPVGPTGPQGIQGVPGVTGSSGISLPTGANNFDQLIWFNGSLVWLPENPKVQVDYIGVTASTSLGYTTADPNWTDYTPCGVLKVYNITPGSSVALNFIYTDTTNTIVTYTYPVTTTGTFVLPLNKVINVTNGGPNNQIQMTLDIVGTATVDVRAQINTAP